MDDLVLKTVDSLKGDFNTIVGMYNDIDWKSLNIPGKSKAGEGLLFQTLAMVEAEDEVLNALTGPQKREVGIKLIAGSFDLRLVPEWGEELFVGIAIDSLITFLNAKLGPGWYPKLLAYYNNSGIIVKDGQLILEGITQLIDDTKTFHEIK